MNEHVKMLWVAIIDNRVIAAGTNAADFFKSFAEATKYSKKYHTFIKLLTDEKHYPVTIGDKTYYFQKVV